MRRTPTAGRALLPVLCAAVILSVVPGAHAQDPAYVHVVRPGETLASIAQRYYGDPQRETVLVAENGLMAHGGAAIVVGMRLLIPHVSYHRVTAGETWAELATRYYGDPRRAFVLIEANNGTPGEQPDEGAQLLIPYPLRHVGAQGDTVTRLAKLYYSDKEGVGRLHRFNSVRGNRLARGQILLVPLADLVLSDEGRQAIAQQTGHAPAAGQIRRLQAQIDAKLPDLRADVRTGRYTDGVALGNRLLGAGDLTGNQVVTIQRELGSAYVALGRTDLAVDAFRAALERQPDLELDGIRTSPTVLAAFHRAKHQAAQAQQHAQAHAAAHPATPGDAGTAPAHDAGPPPAH